MQISALIQELGLQQTNVKTALRYPGGKSKAVNKIMPLFPKEFAEYREPFVGGGSVFIATKQLNPDAFYKINDLNGDVYCFYCCLKQNPKVLVSAVKEIKEKFHDGRTLFNNLRRARPSGKVGRAVRYYVLNRISYSGTVDCGGYSEEAFQKRFTLSKINQLDNLANLLSDVEIFNESYDKLLLQPGQNVFIFLDPPYWNARNSPLYGFNGNLNRSFNHEDFAKKIRECPHKWLMTCDDSKIIRDLFSFANIYPWELKYNGLNKKSAIMGKELFITNYNP